MLYQLDVVGRWILEETRPKVFWHVVVEADSVAHAFAQFDEYNFVVGYSQEVPAFQDSGTTKMVEDVVLVSINQASLGIPVHPKEHPVLASSVVFQSIRR